MSKAFDFRLIPCYTPHPKAQTMADQYEHLAKGGSPSSFLTDEEFAGAITLCAHTLAVLFIRMLKRTNPVAVFTALQSIGEMIGTLVQGQFATDQKALLVAKNKIQKS